MAKKEVQKKRTKREDCEYVATELSTLMGLKPSIDITLPDDDLIEKIQEAQAMLFPEDQIPHELKLAIVKVNRYIGGTWTVPKIVSVLLEDVSFEEDIEEDVETVLKDEEVLGTIEELMPEEDDVEDLYDKAIREPETKTLQTKSTKNPDKKKSKTIKKTVDVRLEKIPKPKKVKVVKEKGTAKKGRPSKYAHEANDPDLARVMAKVLVEAPEFKEGDKKSRGHRGLSAHGVALEVLCANPNATLVEIYKEIARRRVVVPKGNNGVRAAQILVRKITGLLRQSGHMK